ncbi:hypothetical protein KJ969_03135 [Patescibacteria group bacterium]|nr:hypothetical protein [Patescibacteria group bacterium]MBU1921865.1 hypothetical protein [Patescibacteria group bacterium]
MTEKKLKLDVDQASELKAAFRRGGWTNEDIKRMCEGSIILDIRDVIRGTAKIVPVNPPEFPAFKTIKLGTGPKTADEWRVVLEAAGCRVNNLAYGMIKQAAFKVAEHETEVEAVVVSVEELGFFEELEFVEGIQRDQIYGRAKKFGLGLCPAELGPQLAHQYPEQPKGGVLLVAMEPIQLLPSNNLEVFEVGNNTADGRRRLSTNHGHHCERWSGSTRWVFVRPK